MNLQLSPDELIAAYPYMFPQSSMDNIVFIKGWSNTFSKLCVEIDEAIADERDARNFRWSQCKSKFGAARWYFRMQSDAPVGIKVSEQQADGSLKLMTTSPSSDPLMQKISDLVDAAHEQTSHECAVCGAPAKIGNYGGLYATYCPSHARMAEAGQKLAPHHWSPSGRAEKWWS